VRQYRLICAEKELLATTLTASVKTLTEVLAMVAPWAFQRSAFAQSCVNHALPKLEWPDEWIYTIAASLSQIGCVGIPADIVQADAAQRKLTDEEKKLLLGHPEVAGRLVENIPRLELVAGIIRHQAKEPAPNVLWRFCEARICCVPRSNWKNMPSVAGAWSGHGKFCVRPRHHCPTTSLRRCQIFAQT
jgi:hypothetical protein